MYAFTSFHNIYNVFQDGKKVDIIDNVFITLTALFTLMVYTK